MEKLALEIFDRDGGGSKYAFLPSDTSITVIDTSELFDSGDIWTYSFKLNIYDNAHIFGSAGEMHGSRLHEQVDKRRARLWVLGLPLYYGYIRLADEVEVDDDGTVDISFESGQKTFLDMIEGAKANQVPLKDDVFIGMAVKEGRTLSRTGAQIQVNGYSTVSQKNEFGDIKTVNLIGPTDFAQEFPKHIRPTGTWEKIGTGERKVISSDMTINRDYPYDAAHPYCNTRICYQKHIFESKNNELENVATTKYKVSEPQRINPAPNFYLLYWLDCLMKHLGIHIEENDMLNVEDLKRLFFVNTKCAYKPMGDYYIGPYPDEAPAYRSLQFNPFGRNFVPIGTTDDPSCELTAKKLGEQWSSYEWSAVLTYVGWGGTDDTVRWSKAYATSDNFPNVDIKDVIEAIENGFGVRFLFNNDYTKVRIVMLRDILRSQEVHELPCDVTEVTKQESSIRGFRLTYGAGEDNTYYFYRGFSQKLTGKAELWPDTSDTHDYSQWDMTRHYGDIKDEVGMLNKTCYIDSTTGNAYIVKIDENWKNAGDDAHPALFECAPFMDAEDGDCTGDDETIKEVRIGFSPIIENTVPGGYAMFVKEEMGVSSEETGIGYDTKPSEMPPLLKDSIEGDQSIGCTKSVQTRNAQSGLFEIATKTSFNPITVTVYNANHSAQADIEISGYIRDGYRIYLQDNYKPGDDLESPLEKADWGLTLGIMRGSGSDAYIKYSNDPEDNEGNDTWNLQAGSGAFAHSDTCNDSGTEWDYNGEIVVSSATDAQNALNTLFPDSNAPFNDPTSGFINGTDVRAVYDNDGKRHNVLFVWSRNLPPYSVISYSELMDYIAMLSGHTTAEMLAIDAANRNIIVETDTYGQRDWTLVTLCGLAYSGPESFPPYYIDNGVGSEYGRISLKLRAEKPNPYFDPTQEEGPTNKRYLDITTPALRKRGLMDQFHKEESYWWLHGKTAKQKVPMEVSQYLSIDKTVRQRIGDITGFVKKMQFSVHIQTGMSDVTVEMLYL